VITAVRNGDSIDRFHTSGSAIQQVGWKALDISAEKKTKSGKVSGDELRLEQVLPPGLALGQPQDVVDIQTLKKKTRPPKRLTEATLLTAMETAGKTLDEKELSEAMKETGLGTPATRAAIIEVLLKRGVPGIHQIHFQAILLQHLKHRHPIHARGLHGHAPHAFVDQPPRHLAEIHGKTSEAPHRLRIAIRADRHPVLAATHIDPGCFRVDDIECFPIHLRPSRSLLRACQLRLSHDSPISTSANGLGPVPIRK
jgi:hypothetical protein